MFASQLEKGFHACQPLKPLVMDLTSKRLRILNSLKKYKVKKQFKTYGFT
jgi:hypothetical protein